MRCWHKEKQSKFFRVKRKSYCEKKEDKRGNVRKQKDKRE